MFHLKKIVSILLIICLTAGLLPAETSAAKEKGGVEPAAVQEVQSSPVPENTVFPEEWKGLGYSLFTGDKTGVVISSYGTYVNGDVHSNQDFTFSGMEFQVSGALEAAGRIVASTLPNGQKIGKKTEYGPEVPMPDITKELKEYIKDGAAVYQNGKSFSESSLTLNKPVYIDGTAYFQNGGFLREGILYAKDGIVYNAPTLSTPDDSRVFICAEKGDITLVGSDINMNAVLYAPNGCVYVNANNFTLNGRIIADRVCFSASNIRINGGGDDYGPVDFLFKPEADITVRGNLKENRKVILTIDQEKEDLIADRTEWTITKKGDAVTERSYGIDEENSDGLKKELIFREAGEYTVQALVTNGKSMALLKRTLVISADNAPEANFSVDSSFLRGGDKKAVIPIKDLSWSEDGDAIGKRVWQIYYDENNDGVYEEENKIILSDANEERPVFETTRVGKYKVELAVTETFSDTIDKLLDENAFRTADTSHKAEREKEFTVDNLAPEAMLNVEKAKAADLVFTVGLADTGRIAQYGEKVQELEAMLRENGVDARVSTVSTSKLTAQDTFAWKEYDHYNYSDRYLPTLDKHIQYNGSDIKMVGYSYAPLKDFLFVPDHDPGQKIFNFDLQRDGTDWHSMEGGGFLFNTEVSDEKNTISGFRNGSYPNVQNAGRLLRTFPIRDLYANHHIKIVVDPETISVWDGDTLVIDRHVLPDNDYGYGYGPLISHDSHSCYQQSYFTFKNITMETVTGERLMNVLENYEWRDGASRYVVNLSEETVPELENASDSAALAKILIEKGIAFTGIGNEKNEDQYKGLLNAASTTGGFFRADELAASMDLLNNGIRLAMLAGDYTIDRYITTDNRVDYTGYYGDPEGDPVYEEQWEYEYDDSVFGEPKENGHKLVRTGEPIRRFENTGAWSIRLRVRDNPVGENDALDEYRKWSGEEEYQKLLIVQSRPVVTLKADILENKAAPDFCTVNVSSKAYDPDHPSDKKKGIRSEEWSYKNAMDTAWTKGRIPNKVPVGENYLVKVVVTDVEGTESSPAVCVIGTEELKVPEPVEDTQAPELFITLSKDMAETGERVEISAWASDNMGVDSFELYVADEKVLNTYGRTFYTGSEAGPVLIKAAAVDIYGNRSEKTVTLTLEDHSDRTAPETVIRTPDAGAVIKFPVQITGTAKDDRDLDCYSLSYRKKGSEEAVVFARSSAAVTDGILGELDPAGLEPGSYEILLTAADKAGNQSYYGIEVHINGGAAADDRMGPKVTVSRTVLSEQQNAVEFYGSITDDKKLKHYAMEYRNASGSAIQFASGTEEIDDGLLGTMDISGLASGLYTITVHAADEEGNRAELNGTLHLTITEAMPSIGFVEQKEPDDDQTPPEAVLATVIDAEGREMSFTGSVQDDRAVRKYTLTIQDPDGAETVISEGTEERPNELLGTASYEGWKAGTWKIILKVWDTSGNEAEAVNSLTLSQTGVDEDGGDNQTPRLSMYMKEPTAAIRQGAILESAGRWEWAD